MLLAQVRRSVTERELLRRGDHVLVACSGGADSVALVHAMHRLRRELGITVAVASIDHGLREESAAEVRMVASLTEGLGLPFSTRTLALENATGPGGGPGISARARDARYAALSELADEQGAGVVAVGHTRTDQAETVLARILRGTGLRGLSSIAPRRRDGVVRPLIDCERHDVRAYAAYHQLPFVDDPTNKNTRYERARLRHDVFPLLLKEDPQLVRHLADIADEAATTNQLIDTLLNGAPDTASCVQAVTEIGALPPAITVHWMARWLGSHVGRRPDRRHLEAACRLLRGTGEVLLGSGWQLRRQDDELRLEHIENDDSKPVRP